MADPVDDAQRPLVALEVGRQDVPKVSPRPKPRLEQELPVAWLLDWQRLLYLVWPGCGPGPRLPQSLEPAPPLQLERVVQAGRVLLESR